MKKSLLSLSAIVLLALPSCSERQNVPVYMDESRA